MDGLVNSIAAAPDACLYGIRGDRISGFYHQLKLVEQNGCESRLSGFTDLARECQQNGVSAGKFIAVAGGGRGTCLMIQKILGPFQG